MEIREDAEQAKSTGGMIALYPADPTPLVIDGGEPAEDLHITLAYLGSDVTGWPENQVRVLADLLQVAADETRGPIHAEVTGHATFSPGGDEPVAVHLVGGSDRLTPLHARVAEVLAAVFDDDVHPQHAPWIPHITGRYGADASALSYTGPVVLDRLVLKLGEDQWSYPLLSPDQVVDELAREAFAHGWACSGGPMTDRVRAASLLAVEHVRTHGATPAVLEATIKLGSLEGTWAKVLGRREALYKDRIAAVTKAWLDLVGGLELLGLVTSWRRTLGIPTETAQVRVVTELAQVSGGQPDTAARRKAEALAAALLLLQGKADPTDAAYQAALREIATALAQASAEGYAGALALAADQLGEPNIDFDAAFTDALGMLGDPGTYYGQAHAEFSKLIRGAAESIARIMESSSDEADVDDVAGAASDALTNAGYVDVLMDWAMGLAFNNGVMALFGAENISMVDFVTVGDERVCMQCEAAEAGSPYARGDAPLPALHPRCRCTLVNSDPWTALTSIDLSRYIS